MNEELLLSTEQGVKGEIEELFASIPLMWIVSAEENLKEVKRLLDNDVDQAVTARVKLAGLSEDEEIELRKRVELFANELFKKKAKEMFKKKAKKMLNL